MRIGQTINLFKKLITKLMNIQKRLLNKRLILYNRLIIKNYKITSSYLRKKLKRMNLMSISLIPIFPSFSEDRIFHLTPKEKLFHHFIVQESEKMLRVILDRLIHPK